MKFIGLKPGGEEIVLPAPAEWWFDSSEDAPADGFRGVFPISADCGVLSGLRIENGGVFFLGTADVQRETVSGSGRTLRLTCRSLAALLLDSEAEPQTYEYPDLATVFTRHVKPYGFTSFSGSTQIFRGPLRVTKSMSEWQAAALFCRTFLGTAPRVRGKIFDASGTAAGDPLLLDCAAGTLYSSAEVRCRRCDRYSEIDLLTPAGTYACAAADAESASLGVARKRLITTTSADAAALLKSADRRAFAVLAESPGAPAAAVGAGAALNDPLLGSFSGLTVSGVTWTGGTGGSKTQYRLRKD